MGPPAEEGQRPPGLHQAERFQQAEGGGCGPSLCPVLVMHTWGLGFSFRLPTAVPAGVGLVTIVIRSWE